MGHFPWLCQITIGYCLQLYNLLGKPNNKITHLKEGFSLGIKLALGHAGVVPGAPIIRICPLPSHHLSGGNIMLAMNSVGKWMEFVGKIAMTAFIHSS